MKKDYIEGLHDTLDLVPIGAWFGNGRKAGWQVVFSIKNELENGLAMSFAHNLNTL